MKHLFLVLGTAVVVVPWLTGARVHADMIQWSASGIVAAPGQAQDVGVTPPWSFGAITLINGTETSGTNSGSVLLTTLHAVVTTPDGIVDFSGSSGNYSVELKLQDMASGATGYLHFNGNLNANYGVGWGNITNTFLSPTTQSLTLGKEIYTVTIGPFVTPGVPTNPIIDPSNGNPIGEIGSPGSISATISVQSAVSSAPEPSSLLLTCLGLAPLGLARWSRRRRRAVDRDASNA
ncbi:MAG: PEP-CTERM sorting domain-containing protein [Gemmataceae bacterium]